MQRLDLLLVQRGLCDSRARAQRVIREGRVQIRPTPSAAWQVADKVGLKLSELTELSLTAADEDRFVSRGALKLLPALQQFCPDLKGQVALDVGQSTGGFTDCLLQQGTARVVGIEVGHDQLAARLREDPRVICLEGYNARALGLELLGYTSGQGGFDLAVMDVSFISQTLILDSLAPLLREGGLLFTLIKPQFEVGPEHVGKGGIVRNPALYAEVCERIQAQCQALGLKPLRLDESPILGGDGNHEFVLVARKQSGPEHP